MPEIDICVCGHLIDDHDQLLPMECDVPGCDCRGFEEDPDA